MSATVPGIGGQERWGPAQFYVQRDLNNASWQIIDIPGADMAIDV